jgi:hypothetical protein
LSGGGLCDGLITHAEECGVSEGKLEPSTKRRPGILAVRLLRVFVLSGGGLCDGLITHAEECGVSEGKLEP